MAADDNTDAGRILEYLYMHQNELITQETLFKKSDLSDEDIRTALDELEERLLVDIGISPDEASYEDITITDKGIDTIETENAFHDTFNTPLDLNKIAQEWSN